MGGGESDEQALVDTPTHGSTAQMASSLPSIRSIIIDHHALFHHLTCRARLTRIRSVAVARRNNAAKKAARAAVDVDGLLEVDPVEPVVRINRLI